MFLLTILIPACVSSSLADNHVRNCAEVTAEGKRDWGPYNLLLAQLCAKGLSSSDPGGIGIGGFHLWGESVRRKYGRDVIQ